MARSTITIEGLDHAELAALGVVKGPGDLLQPGDYPVDCAVRITGTVSKAKATTFTPTVSIPHKAALAFLVQFAGLAGEAALKLLSKAMTAALQADSRIHRSEGERLEDVLREAAPAAMDRAAAEESAARGGDGK